MKSVLVAVVVILGSVAAALSLQPRPALACSGPGPVEGLLPSTVIIEGRVTSMTRSGEPEFDRIPYKITFEVAHAFKGAAAGQKVVATGYIPIPGKPIMCPQFPQDLLGKYVVIGLGPDEAHPQELHTVITPFIGDKPEGETYAQAVRLAEMISDSNPAAPQLLLDPPVATCGQPMRFVGRRFPEGPYLLRYGFGRAIAQLNIGSSGTFDVTASIVHEICRDSRNNSRLVSFYVDGLVDDPPWIVLDPLGPTEAAAVPIAGAVDREPRGPTLTITPKPARCGDALTVRGAGFEPAEQLTVTVAGETSGVPATADAVGSFAVQLGSPAGLCTGPFIGVAAIQSGFEPFRWAVAGGEVYVASTPTSPAPSATPGPPDVGTGPPVGAQDGHGLLMAGAALLLASFAVGAATRNSARRPSS